MNESCCDQNTSTEMLAEEKHLRRNLHPADPLGHHWKSCSEDAEAQDQNYQLLV